MDDDDPFGTDRARAQQKRPMTDEAMAAAAKAEVDEMWRVFGWDKAEEVQRIRAAVIEECARVAENACLVPPDGGSPTEDEQRVAEAAAAQIRALSSHPPETGEKAAFVRELGELANCLEADPAFNPLTNQAYVAALRKAATIILPSPPLPGDPKPGGDGR